VRANRGAAGIDRITLAAVEQYGVERLLDELVVDLKAESSGAPGLRPEARP
jgi:RNA-directed DNA polymerase